MKDNDVEELKKEMRRIERERQDHTNFIIGCVIVVIVLIAGAVYWSTHHLSSADTSGNEVNCSDQPFSNGC